jgi:hypothetical protein
MASNLLVRKKRVSTEGEWEYECAICLNWFPKVSFSGCRKAVDAYANCLLCKKCKHGKIKTIKEDNVERLKNEILTDMGFFNYKDSNEWYEAKKIQHSRNK